MPVNINKSGLNWSIIFLINVSALFLLFCISIKAQGN